MTTKTTLMWTETTVLEALRKLKARVYSDQMPMKTKVTGMETKTITIHVSPEAASAYETASADQQRKLDALLSLKLGEVIRAKRPLEVIMSEISRKAQERGLTPEILESILNE